MKKLKILEQLDRIEKMIQANKKVLTLDEACEYTGISRGYMYKLTARGEIPFSKPRGKLIYFDKEKLDQWLLSQPSKSRAEIDNEALNYVFRKGKSR
ncbi:helix-turn-helix transcriptional regulator [Gillisia sp. Q332]|uniref:helix-turn-helix transcriptional regulator n=1 Tax=Gillisia xinjiangensis TaxID=3384765 RepID=UPI00391D4D68